MSSEHCSSKTNISKYANVQLGNTSSAIAITTNTAMQLLDMEHPGKVQEDMDAKAKKDAAKKEALLAKKDQVGTEDPLAVGEIFVPSATLLSS